MSNIFNLSIFSEYYNGSNMAGFEETDFGKYTVESLLVLNAFSGGGSSTYCRMISE
jgi:hypothetical protein